MIRFALRCREAGHGFEGWFRSNADFDAQAERGLLECPACGSPHVEKALMRPAVVQAAAATAPARPAGAPNPAPAAAISNNAPPEFVEAVRQLQEMARRVRAEADYVGPGFAQEARRIHYGEALERRIYGEASGEEGITALPLPPLPEDAN